MRINRKAGVVIGLTVILTFPVTVVSGAGSPKRGENETRIYRDDLQSTGGHAPNVRGIRVTHDPKSPLTMPRGTHPAL